MFQGKDCFSVADKDLFFRANLVAFNKKRCVKKKCSASLLLEVASNFLKKRSQRCYILYDFAFSK